MEVLREAPTTALTQLGLWVSILVLMEVLREELTHNDVVLLDLVSILVLMEVLREGLGEDIRGGMPAEFQSLF